MHSTILILMEMLVYEPELVPNLQVVLVMLLLVCSHDDILGLELLLETKLVILIFILDHIVEALTELLMKSL